MTDKSLTFYEQYLDDNKVLTTYELGDSHKTLLGIKTRSVKLISKHVFKKDLALPQQF